MTHARLKNVAAAKDYPDAGIVAGERYWLWQQRENGKWVTHRSKTQPGPEQLITSVFRRKWYVLNKRLADFEGEPFDSLGSIVTAFKDLGAECETKYNNLKPGPRTTAPGKLLQERAELCYANAKKLEKAMALYDQFMDQDDLTDDERYGAMEEIRKLAELEEVEI